MIAGYKIAAGITHDRNLQFPYQINNILSHPLFIGKRTVFLVNAFINSPPEMLNKGTEDSFVHLSGKIIFVYNQFCFFIPFSIPPCPGKLTYICIFIIIFEIKNRQFFFSDIFDFSSGSMLSS